MGPWSRDQSPEPVTSILFALGVLYHCYLIEAEWRMYASVKHTTFASDNGLSPVRRQAIIWTNVAILSIRP